MTSRADPAEPLTPRGGHPVLVVEDDASASLLCRLLLERAGFTVVSAADGASGVALAREHAPAAIVLDYMLPDMDGIAVLEALHADPTVTAIPVVMLTARTDPRDQQAAWEAGVSDYVTKPYDADRLLAAVLHSVAPEGDEERARRRREALDRLRARDMRSLEQMASIVEHSEDSIISVTLDGMITSWNQAAVDLYGYEGDETIGQSASLLVPAEQVDEISDILDRIARGAHVIHYETVRQRKNGHLVDVSLSVSPIKGAAGEVTGASVIGRDVTERRRSEARFRSLVETAPDAMVIVDERGLIELVNAQTVRLFGYSAADLVGQPVEMLIPLRFRGGHPQHRAGYVAAPQARSMGADLDLYGLHKDGTEFPVEISLSPLETDQGVTVSAAIRDVTQRKQAEARFRGLVEAAPDAMVIVDEHGRIELVNAQTERLFRYPRDELLGCPVEILVPERFRGRHPQHRLEYIDAAKVRGMGAGLDLYGLRKDGTEFPVEISLSPLETEHGVTVSASIRDVTERKQADDARAQAFDQERQAGERLRQIDRLRVDFLSTVSHELRTPLTIINGFADMLASGWGSYEEDQKQDFIQRISVAGARLADLIGDLLDFSRIERGQLVFTAEPLEVGKLVADALRRTRPALENHAVEVVIPEGLGVLADPSAVARVIDNLLDNAAKFSPHGSTISVGAQPTGTNITLTVSDQGIGIPLDELDRVFERFYRVGGPSNRRPGTGIGLAIVKEFTEAQSGRVEVTSTVGRGTTFTILLPAR